MIVISLFWWMEKSKFEKISDVILGILYSPVLVVAAIFETRSAADIRNNRARSEEDDDTIEDAKTNLEYDPTICEVQKLRNEFEELKEMLVEISKAVSAGNACDGQASTNLIDLGEPAESSSSKKNKNEKKSVDNASAVAAAASSSSSDEERKAFI
ncbi:hypothetical protein BDP55DRAFT_734400 [Colletotrichum godetiae]|uniref:Uncharacterized protein n=1 Tax=Colletotrichum godetiae TaxID=1209918 RepID=A0AAJ0A7R1_9PEZI|nr:uncharacterized protein BDP55DRAFT_734400 [Colletotrichum godetiae]KAK1658063.1 hypothetical protein BDP55DRAFT_734400 [Colletotrichum godetiae]